MIELKIFIIVSVIVFFGSLFVVIWLNKKKKVKNDNIVLDKSRIRAIKDALNLFFEIKLSEKDSKIVEKAMQSIEEGVIVIKEKDK